MWVCGWLVVEVASSQPRMLATTRATHDGGCSPHRVEAALQSLFFKVDGHPTHLDDDSAQLGYYGVQDGGEIVMEARDLAKEAEDAAKVAKRKAAHMAEQERTFFS